MVQRKTQSLSTAEVRTLTRSDTTSISSSSPHTATRSEAAAETQHKQQGLQGEAIEYRRTTTIKR